MASSATVGSAVVKLSFDGKNINSELDGVAKNTESKFSGMAGKVGAAVGKASAVVGAGITAASTAVGALAKSAVQSYANYEQLAGGVETLFGSSAGTIMQYASQAYQTAGLSANQYMETVTGFSASLLQSLGGDTAKAAEYANRAVTDMSDNANKMGTSMESIQYAYQGFAKQNYTMLDNLKLGYGGTKEEMARLIQDASKLTDVQKELGVTVDANDMSFGNIVNAISVVQKNMGIMGTTALEAKDTISGSVNSMKAAWQNMLTGLGDDTQDFGGLVSNLISSVGDVVKNLLPTVKVALSQIGKLIGELGPIIIEQLPGLITEIVPALIESAGSIVQALLGVLPGLLTTVIQSIIQYLPTLITMLAQAIPTLITGFTQMIIQIAQMLTQPQFLQMILQAGLQLLMEIVYAIPQMLTQLIAALPEILNNIITFLTDPATIQMLIEAAIQLFLALVMAVPQILGQLVQAFGDLVGNLWNNIVGMFQDFAGQFGDKISGIFRGAVNGVLQFIENFINGPINVINGFVDIINNALSGLGVNIGHIPNVSLPRLAQGGVVDTATTAVIGEAGAEVVLPLENNTNNWAGMLAGILAEEMEMQGNDGRTINVYMTNEINSELDANEIGRVMMQSIRRAA